jgi:competence ComEA-like helix-hairpin-helix protein
LFLIVRAILANKYETSSVVGTEEVSSTLMDLPSSDNNLIPPKEFKRSNKASRKSKKTDEMVEINSADTTRLMQLRGIGSGYAKMIVAYREKLGGFYTTTQLLEVYKFSEETYKKIQSQLTVDTTLIRKIPINTATVKQLKSHPYISYYQALSIVENRALQVDMRYNSLYDMVVDEDLKEEDILRVAPYLSFE